MATMAVFVTGGVDTHGHTHHAAVLNCIGRQLGDREFPTSPAGYRALLQWMSGHGVLDRVGVEGTGTYGVALARYLRGAGVLTSRPTVRIDEPGGHKASLIRWTLTQQRGPRCRALHRWCRSCVTAASKPFERSGWPAPAPSKRVVRPRIRSKPYSSPGRHSCASNCATYPRQ
jgi:hypothetical protein